MLILLDLIMPEMDGFQFLAELHKNDAWQTIPVVVLTAKDLTPEERSLLSGNVERILQKGNYGRVALLKDVRKAVALHTGRRLSGKDRPEISMTKKPRDLAVVRSRDGK